MVKVMVILKWVRGIFLGMCELSFFDITYSIMGDARLFLSYPRNVGTSLAIGPYRPFTYMGFGVFCSHHFSFTPQ